MELDGTVFHILFYSVACAYVVGCIVSGKIFTNCGTFSVVHDFPVNFINFYYIQEHAHYL